MGKTEIYDGKSSMTIGIISIIAGLFVPIVGIILSIIGLAIRKSELHYGRDVALNVVGMITSILSWIISAIIIFSMLI